MDIREWILGSDVNIVRFVDEQNGGDKNIRDRKIFNDIISYMGLITYCSRIDSLPGQHKRGSMFCQVG